MPGCGYYASEIAAASATGWGEAIASVVLCKSAVDAVERGVPVKEAAHTVLARMRERILNRDRVGAAGGLLLLDRTGRGAWAYSTPVMARAGWCRETGVRRGDWER